jgi:hypothetical protein
MDLQLQNDVGIMVTMEDDMTQPSTTTEASTKVLPRPKIVQGKNINKKMLPKNKSKYNFQRF